MRGCPSWSIAPCASRVRSSAGVRRSTPWSGQAPAAVRSRESGEGETPPRETNYGLLTYQVATAPLVSEGDVGVELPGVRDVGRAEDRPLVEGILG